MDLKEKRSGWWHEFFHCLGFQFYLWICLSAWMGEILPNLIPFISLFFQVPCEYAIILDLFIFVYIPYVLALSISVFRHWLVDGARCILFIYVVIHSWFNLSIGVECQRFDMRGKPMSQRYYFSFWNLCRFGIRWWNEATITVKKSAARQQWSFRLSFGHLKKEQEKIPPEHIKSCCAFFVDGPFCFFMDKPNPLSSLSWLRV